MKFSPIVRHQLFLASAVSALLLGSGLAVRAAEGPLIIGNKLLLVTFDPSQGQFTIARNGCQRPFVSGGRFARSGGTARMESFKVARKIEVTYSDGGQDLIVLAADAPFVGFQSKLVNPGTEAKVHNRVPVVSFNVDLGRVAGGTSARDWRTLGTGGLTAPDRNPGSYAWLAVADAKTRNGVVGGWLSHDRGSGVVFSKIEGGQVRLEARIDYGRLRILPGKCADTETFALGWFDDARLGLEAWADAVARVYSIKLPPLPTGFCTYYSEKHGGASDEKHLVELAEFAAKHLKPYGFQFVQIDEGWSLGVPSASGPRRNFTTHDPKGPYPHGMKATAENIARLGLVPGIWYMPFAGTYIDPCFAGHPEWFVKRGDGKPFEAYWTGNSLDLTHPGVQAYVGAMARRMAAEWGYTFFKMDGMHAGTATKQTYPNMGYTEDDLGDAVFHDPDKTNIEAYRDGIKLIRRAAGKGVFLLGCCIPQNMRSYSGAFGLLDAMRIGPDDGASWKSWVETTAVAGGRNYFLNGRIWWNDPDCLYARKGFSLEQARSICSWTALSGQLSQSSDWLPDLPPERLDILRRTMPPHGHTARPVDLLDADPACVWLVTDRRAGGRRDVLGLFSFGPGGKKEIDLPLERIGLPPARSYAVFDFWANTFLPPLAGRLKASLPEGSCRILAVRPVQEHPQLLSTSRHVTQGMLDVLKEEWDPQRRELRGRSRVVGGDHYELRITTACPKRGWWLEAAEVSAADQAAGVTVHAAEGRDGIRVAVQSAADCEVAWTVRFKSEQ